MAVKVSQCQWFAALAPTLNSSPNINSNAIADLLHVCARSSENFQLEATHISQLAGNGFRCCYCLIHEYSSFDKADDCL
jgi:hypothetical protein